MYPFRNYLFKLDPERAHTLTLGALGLAGEIAPARWILRLLCAAPSRPVKAFGLSFKNPIGLAAGYDKDARAVRGLAALGFGYIEVGTVTPLPQPGNPGPRLFRLVEDEALINRLGFPSKGSASVQRRLSPRMRGSWLTEMLGIPGRTGPRRTRDPHALRLKAGCILGVNIGRNASTPNEEAVLDYLSLLESFAPQADYLAVNVSSPNTVGLRALQQETALAALLDQLHAQRSIEQEKIGRPLPLLVKLSPDLSNSELDAALDAVVGTHMDGVIVTNTTLARDGVRSETGSQQGGLSGAPLRRRSEAVLQRTVDRVAGKIAIVSTGGVLGSDDVQRRFAMGADLVQLYTGLVYRGPGLVRQILRDLPS